MQSFPGRWDGGALWVEAEPVDEFERSERSRRTDGVSSLQREMAFRAGVNIVMYALTGNYKADQVHVPALLERLGQ